MKTHRAHIAFALALSLLTACSGREAVKPDAGTDTAKPDAGASTAKPDAGADTAKSRKINKLQIEDLVVGTGDEAVSGRVVSVHYTGWLLDGTKFDSSYDRGKPIEFQLGGGRVIQGWEQGLEGMKVGGKRKLIIPPKLGYGSKGAGNVIPPDAVLVFEVELMDVS